MKLLNYLFFSMFGSVLESCELTGVCLLLPCYSIFYVTSYCGHYTTFVNRCGKHFVAKMIESLNTISAIPITKVLPIIFPSQKILL